MNSICQTAAGKQMMSLWKSVNTPATEPADGTITAADLVKMIREPEDEIIKAVDAARAELAKGCKSRFKQIKSALPVVALSGTFYGRAADKLEEHNGLLCLDFDDLTADEMSDKCPALAADPHTYIQFRSVSGAGIKVVVRVPVTEDGTGHAEAFAAAERYFEEAHGLKLDRSGKDVSRLCFLSHDPLVFLNPDAQILDVEAWAPLSETEKLDERLDKLSEDCRIQTLKNPPPPPRVVLASASGQTIATPGNLVTVEGLQKAGKSAVIGACIASAVSGEDATGDFLGIVANVPPDSFVLHFDCEQSTDDHHRLVTSAITKRAGMDDIPDRMWTFSLLRVELAERWALVERLCQRIEGAGRNVGLIILDGAADFVPGVNDEEVALRFVATLHGLADRLGAVVMAVIHENPGDNGGGKTRGHLGSELWRKSQGCLGVKKGADCISTLWGKFLRSGDWPERDGAFFRYDLTQGMHVSCDDPSTERSAERDRQKIQKLEKLAATVLPVPASFSALKAAIEEEEKCVETTAKTRIREMQKHGIIIKMEGGSYARAN